MFTPWGGSKSTQIINLDKEGHWEYNLKYIEQNCFSYFLNIQWTNMGTITTVD